MSEAVTPPIVVKATATPVVMSEGFKIAITAGLAWAADHFMHSETAIIAVIAAGGIVATFLWGVWHRLRSWSALRFLASIVPDSVAKVGK